MADPGPSPDAFALYRAIRRYGGSLRVATLRKWFPPHTRSALCSAIDELAERYWIRVVLLDRAPAQSDTTCPLDGIDRLCITPFARRKHRAGWGMG
jgi:hypothetical protein